MTPVLDVVTRVAPLGMRFADPLDDTPVTDGLVVTVTVPDGSVLRALPNRSGGAWVIHHVPGLEEAERGTGTEAFWDALVAGPSLRVDVSDPAGRYLPCWFDTRVPHRGVLTDPCSTGADAITLWPAPSYPVGPGFGVVRAQLEDVRNDRAARWAVLSVAVGGQVVGRGLSDEEGRVLVVFGYPPVVANVAAVPPLPPVSEQTWPVTLELRYGDLPDPPSLCTATIQPVGRLLARVAPNETPFGAADLTLGRPLVLKSNDVSVLRCRRNP